MTNEKSRSGESGPSRVMVGETQNQITAIADASGVAPAWERTGGGIITLARRKQPLPGLASVVAGQPWFLNASPERRRQMLQVVQKAAERAATRKARVAAHPDLAKRLCRVLPLKRFEQWGGYVPAQQSEAASGRGTAFDTSVVRRELVAILREVAERDEATTLNAASAVTPKVNSAVRGERR